MRYRINAVVVLALAFATFAPPIGASADSQAPVANLSNGASKSEWKDGGDPVYPPMCLGKHRPTTAPKDGPGPVYPPGGRA